MNTWIYGYSQIHGTRSKKDRKLRDKSVLYFQKESGHCPLDWRITIHSNVDLVFSKNLDIYYYAGKLPEQDFSVWLLSNPGYKILFLLKFNEARISEWNICVFTFHSFSVCMDNYWTVYENNSKTDFLLLNFEILTFWVFPIIYC